MSQADLPYITGPPFSNAYAAGFFDGEGCVSLFYMALRRWKSDPSKRIHGFRLVVVISNTDWQIIKLFRARFGGQAYQDMCRPAVPSRKPIYTWRINGADLQTYFLRAILPFSLVKKAQVEIALKYLETSVGAGRRVSQSSWDIRLICYKKMQALNKRGIGAGHKIEPRGVASKGNKMGRRPRDKARQLPYHHRSGPTKEQGSEGRRRI